MSYCGVTQADETAVRRAVLPTFVHAVACQREVVRSVRQLPVDHLHTTTYILYTLATNIITLSAKCGRSKCNILSGDKLTQTHSRGDVGARGPKDRTWRPKVDGGVAFLGRRQRAPTHQLGVCRSAVSSPSGPGCKRILGIKEHRKRLKHERAKTYSRPGIFMGGSFPFPRDGRRCYQQQQ